MLYSHGIIIVSTFVLIVVLLCSIQDASRQVDTGSEEIAHAATDLSEGTGEQASAVEELTATINTVSEMAANSAKQTEAAYDNALQSVQTAEKERAHLLKLHGQAMPEGALP